MTAPRPEAVETLRAAHDAYAGYGFVEFDWKAFGEILADLEAALDDAEARGRGERDKVWLQGKAAGEDGMEVAIEQAEARGEARGIERAAEVSRAHACDAADCDEPCCIRVRRVTAAIRALKEEK